MIPKRNKVYEIVYDDPEDKEAMYKGLGRCVCNGAMDIGADGKELYEFRLLNDGCAGQVGLFSTKEIIKEVIKESSTE